MFAYRESQDRILNAENAARAGNTDLARRCYAEAAAMQLKMVDELGADRPKTRAAYTLSAATLYWRAGDGERASDLCRRIESSGAGDYFKSRARMLLRQISPRSRVT